MKYPKRPGLYQKNLERFQKVINYEAVDRIPVAFIGSGFVPRYLDITIADFAADMKVQQRANFEAAEKLGGIDGFNGPITGAPFDVALGSIWLSKVLMPGRELPTDTLWQIEEKERMTVEDYDVLIEEGWNKFQSRFFSEILHDPKGYSKFIFRTILATPGSNRRYKNAGYVPLCGAIGTFPYESLCGARSMSKFFFDLYRIPDKVEQAMDVMLPDMIATLVRAGKSSGAMGVWIGGWRSAGSLIGPEQWNRFVFPYMKKTAEAVVAAGLVPILHIDQDWTRDLERFLEFPAKTCLLNPDGMTDIRKAKEILDGHMAIMGDVPASLFVAGSPGDMWNYVQELVRDVGPQGLILCPGCDAPINAKPENMEAFVAACQEFGAIS